MKINYFISGLAKCMPTLGVSTDYDGNKKFAHLTRRQFLKSAGSSAAVPLTGTSLIGAFTSTQSNGLDDIQKKIIDDIFCLRAFHMNRVRINHHLALEGLKKAQTLTKAADSHRRFGFEFLLKTRLFFEGGFSGRIQKNPEGFTVDNVKAYLHSDEFRDTSYKSSLDTARTQKYQYTPVTIHIEQTLQDTLKSMQMKSRECNPHFFKSYRKYEKSFQAEIDEAFEKSKKRILAEIIQKMPDDIFVVSKDISASQEHAYQYTILIPRYETDQRETVKDWQTRKEQTQRILSNFLEGSSIYVSTDNHVNGAITLHVQDDYQHRETHKILTHFLQGRDNTRIQIQVNGPSYS